MRAKERIPIVLEFFKNNKEAYLKFINSDDTEEYNEFIRCYNRLSESWLNNSDYRFGQLLINTDIISDSNIWNTEEQEWLVKNNYFKFEDIHFWGVNFDKDMNKLKTPYKKLLSELDDDHIENILKISNNINQQYLKYFIQRTKQVS